MAARSDFFRSFPRFLRRGEALFRGGFLFFRNELPTWPDFTPGFRNELPTLQNPISIAPYCTVVCTTFLYTIQTIILYTLTPTDIKKKKSTVRASRPTRTSHPELNAGHTQAVPSPHLGVREGAPTWGGRGSASLPRAKGRGFEGLIGAGCPRPFDDPNQTPRTPTPQRRIEPAQATRNLRV